MGALISGAVAEGEHHERDAQDQVVDREVAKAGTAIDINEVGVSGEKNGVSKPATIDV